MMFRLSVDIGGTFTDLALDQNGELHVHKLLTSPDAPELAALRGIEQLLAEAGVSLSQVQSITHGTTLATNALIERKGARVGFVTTEGFRDVLEMRYEKRFEQYDLDITMPEPLVPRHRRFTIPERILVTGDVLRAPLDEDIDRVAEQLAEEAVDAVAVGFLHAYANPQHERQVAQRLSSRLPEHVTVCLSSDVSPEAREYERFSTVCANAYVRPLMSRYLQQLDDALRGQGFRGSFMLMLSGGGVTTLQQARQVPIRLVESGPAGGVALAARVARQLAFDQTLALDMGGTTAKICFLQAGEPRTTRHFEIARAWRDLKGSGLPVRVPSIELVEIGAGGGSVARVDSLNRLKVGPDSAGAEPGPAAYARGGEQATVTDADLLFGHISATDFAGGQITLDTHAAELAIEKHVTGPLQLGSHQWAAAGILEISEETMANAARQHAVERGYDLTGTTLLASGGGGPLHAVRIAEKLSIRRVVVPQHAGVGSAVGFLHAPIAYEKASSFLTPLPRLDATRFVSRVQSLMEDTRAVVAPVSSSLHCSWQGHVELRFCGQGQMLQFPLECQADLVEQLNRMDAVFRAHYEQSHGFSMPGIDVELVAVSVTATVPPPDEAPGRSSTTPNSAAANDPDAIRPGVGGKITSLLVGTRTVFDRQRGQDRVIKTYVRDTLPVHLSVSGPCLLTESQTTSFVPDGWTVLKHPTGHLILEQEAVA